MKKQLKSGFTLAEVLITLAIIGIVAAIVMPSVITSYQFKTVGVKLAKFQSTIENAARAYVVSNDSFKVSDSTITTSGKADINNFVNECLIFKSILAPKVSVTLKNNYLTGLEGDDSSYSSMGLDGTEIEYEETTGDGKTSTKKVNVSLIGVMKDNTKVALLPISADSDAANWSSNTTNKKMKMIEASKVGSGAFILLFDPNVTGLQKNIHRTFSFVITELGYMYPAANDDCLWDIYGSDFVTNSKTFKAGSSCTTQITTK